MNFKRVTEIKGVSIPPIIDAFEKPVDYREFGGFEEMTYHLRLFPDSENRGIRLSGNATAQHVRDAIKMLEDYKAKREKKRVSP